MRSGRKGHSCAPCTRRSAYTDEQRNRRGNSGSPAGLFRCISSGSGKFFLRLSSFGSVSWHLRGLSSGGLLVCGGPLELQSVLMSRNTRARSTVTLRVASADHDAFRTSDYLVQERAKAGGREIEWLRERTDPDPNKPLHVVEYCGQPEFEQTSRCIELKNPLLRIIEPGWGTHVRGLCSLEPTTWHYFHHITEHSEFPGTLFAMTYSGQWLDFVRIKEEGSLKTRKVYNRATEVA